MIGVKKMIDRNLQKYAIEMWNDDKFFRPLSEISKPDMGKSPLVNIHENIFCFDSISESIYPNNKPCSVDGLFFSGKTAYFVEFKTGFKKKITKDSYCEEQALCPTYKQPCEHHKKWFFKNQENETKELKASIRFKAIESYITLEKQIFPLCECDTEQHYKIEFIVVIDEEEIEDYENTLYELSAERIPSNADKNNIFHSLNESLKSYRCKNDKQSPPNNYFYDNIQVLSAKGFEKLFIDLFS